MEAVVLVEVVPHTAARVELGLQDKDIMVAQLVLHAVLAEEVVALVVLVAAPLTLLVVMRVLVQQWQLQALIFFMVAVVLAKAVAAMAQQRMAVQP